MKTTLLKTLLCGLLSLTGAGAWAQNPGEGFDPARFQQMISDFQQRVAQADPAQLQEAAARLRPEFGQMDPAQFQQMVERFQQGVSQFQERVAQTDPAEMKNAMDQFRQRLAQRLDPAQMRQRWAASIREQMEITDDAEWNAINALILKVMEAQQAIQSEAPRFMALGLGTNALSGIMGRLAASPSLPEALKPSPEGETLRKAVQEKAADSDLKAALKSMSELRKTHQAALEKAQADLRTVLTIRQEAVAALSGLL
jgi:hypothetical protein